MLSNSLLTSDSPMPRLTLSIAIAEDSCYYHKALSASKQLELTIIHCLLLALTLSAIIPFFSSYFLCYSSSSSLFSLPSASFYPSTIASFLLLQMSASLFLSCLEPPQHASSLLLPFNLLMLQTRHASVSTFITPLTEMVHRSIWSILNLFFLSDLPSVFFLSLSLFFLCLFQTLSLSLFFFPCDLLSFLVSLISYFLIQLLLLLSCSLAHFSSFCGLFSFCLSHFLFSLLFPASQLLLTLF